MTTVRIRSDRLPADSPRRRWIERRDGRFTLCCGHCLRRFPRDTIRQAENLRDLHAIYCKPRRPTRPTRERHARPATYRKADDWTPEMDAIIATCTVPEAMAALDVGRGTVEYRRKILRRRAA